MIHQYFFIIIVSIYIPLYQLFQISYKFQQKRQNSFPLNYLFQQSKYCHDKFQLYQNKKSSSNPNINRSNNKQSPVVSNKKFNNPNPNPNTNLISNTKIKQNNVTPQQLQEYLNEEKEFQNDKLINKNIFGQNIINCRNFAVDAPKIFHFVGSYDNHILAPKFPVPEIAFIGRSNVGKSSLLNLLSGMNKNVAVVSKTPGRTRMINLFRVADKDGDICMLVDLPGYGFAKMAKDEQTKLSAFIRDYFENRGSLRLVVVLIDIRREVQESDQEIMDFLDEEGITYFVVATKCDKLNNQEQLKMLTYLNERYLLPPGQPLPVSSVTGLGKKDLWRVIKSGILGELDSESEEDDEEMDNINNNQ